MALKDTLKSRMEAARGSEGGAALPRSGSRTRRIGSKAERFVLLLGDEGAILVYTKGKRVQRRLFAPSPQPEHSKTIIDLMAANPKVPLRVLVDSIDQQYVRHALPPVSALSINKLVQRRIDRDFPPEDIKGALLIGRDKTGRKEWNYLLISLANTAHIQSWLELILEQPNQLLGIHLVPVETQHYYPAIANLIPQRTYEGTRAVWKLLVSHNKVGGFRQVVLRDGKLAFTRLAQSLDDAIPAVVAGNVEQEILNTLDYLKRLGYSDPATLEIVAIVSQEVKDALDLKRFGAAGAYALSPVEVADLLGLEQAALSADRYGDVVVSTHFASVSKPALKLMSKYGKQLERYYQIRLGVRIAGGVLAALLLASSLGNLSTLFIDSSEAGSFEDKQRQLQVQVVEVQDSLSKLDEGVSIKSAVVAVMDGFKPYEYLPLDFVQKIGAQLQPDIRITDVSWERRSLPGGDNVPVPSGPTAQAPTMANVEFEFVGRFTDRDEYTKRVREYVDQLQQALPEYAIRAENMPGQGAASERVEVSFGARGQSPALPDGQNKVRIVFEGPNAVANAAAPAPGMGGM